MISLKRTLLFIFLLCFNIVSAQELVLHGKATDVFHEEQTLPDGTQIHETTLLWCGEKHDRKEYEKLIKTIGWVYPTNCLIRHKKSDDKGRSYNVVYDINHLGQRKYAPTKNKKNKHLILAGDSNTFGHGVEDRDSLPFILSEKFKAYHPYNFAHCGGGTNNTLALLESGPWEKEILENEGRMIYVYYPEWMSSRAYGSKEYLSYDKGRTPWYELNEKKELVRKGILSNSWRSKIFLLINFIDWFNLVGDLPKMNIYHAELISKIVIKMKLEYLEKFPSGKFTMVISSYSLTKHNYVPEIISMLKRAGVEVLEINKYDKHDIKWHLLDSHFGPSGQRMTADALSEIIKF